ncbi:MAG: hypothetical protein SNJ52_05070 [Verrucomicrobiia bacterium]
MSKKPTLSGLFSRFFGSHSAPTAFERRLAKIFVKRRLLKLYPTLRGDASLLEQAYQELDIVIGEEVDENGSITFELKTPEGFPTHPS